LASLGIDYLLASLSLLFSFSDLRKYLVNPSFLLRMRRRQRFNVHFQATGMSIERLFALIGYQYILYDNIGMGMCRRRVLVNHEDSGIKITGETLLCLRPGARLNDEVISHLLHPLLDRIFIYTLRSKAYCS